jgi:hypothetical protein
LAHCLDETSGNAQQRANTVPTQIGVGLPPFGLGTFVVNIDDKEAEMIARRRRWRPPMAALGFACGVASGLALIAGGVGGAGVAELAVGNGLRDVLHTPPLLVQQGEPTELRFDAVCQSNPFGAPCELSGTVFVRNGEEEAYQRVSLVPAGETTLAATVNVPQQGLSYYAVVESDAGDSFTVPAAGAAAPHHAWSVPALTWVDLGAHVFGGASKADGRVMSAPWGSGPGQLGLITGKELVRIGPSAFDVSPDGTVVVLDQVNDRLAFYRGATALPRHAAIAFDGAEGDVAIGPDGDVYVLDHGAVAVVRRYEPSGAIAGTAGIHGSGADMLRAAPEGAVLHAYPGDVWQSLGTAGSRAARPARGGVEVVVHGTQDEARFALVRGDRVLRAWRVTSDTTLGEIQLAEPFRGGMLVVLRVWTETKSEFVALVLSPAGLSASFSIDASEWAESAALGRFRLEGETLYQLRSTPSAAEIVTFDLGGA